MHNWNILQAIQCHRFEWNNAAEYEPGKEEIVIGASMCVRGSFLHVATNHALSIAPWLKQKYHTSLIYWQFTHILYYRSNFLQCWLTTEWIVRSACSLEHICFCFFFFFFGTGDYIWNNAVNPSAAVCSPVEISINTNNPLQLNVNESGQLDTVRVLVLRTMHVQSTWKWQHAKLRPCYFPRSPVPTLNTKILKYSLCVCRRPPVL